MRASDDPNLDDPLERMLETLGREARHTPFDPSLPLRVEARLRLDLERRGLEPVATTLGAVAAAALLALGAWLFPGATGPDPATRQGTALPTLDAPATPDAPTPPEEPDR